MQLIDTHCHLDFSSFDKDRQQVVEMAINTSIKQIIVPSVSKKNWQNVKDLTQCYSIIKPAYGLHPMFMKEHKIRDISELREWLKKNPCVAVGECGLDFYIKPHDKYQQVELFVQQLKLAQDFSLPVIIHARKSIDIILKYIKRYPGISGVIHSFSGSMQQAQRCIQQGFKLGFGGPVTYTRASKLRKLVAELPLECLVLETDAPDQPDSRHQGQRNVPANLVDIAQVIADIKHMDIVELARASTANARELFNLTCLH